MKFPLAAALAGLALVVSQSALGTPLRAEMSELPDDSGSWERIGDGYAFVIDGDYLAVNDNSNSERIAFQHFVEGLTPSHELRVHARLRVLSNVGGRGATLELARPGLEIIARLYVDHIVLGERDEAGGFRWLGQVEADLSSNTELELIKLAATNEQREELVVVHEGDEILRVQPRGLGTLGVGRVLFGSLSNFDMGATIWDWIEIESREVASRLPTKACSMSELKARFGL